MNTVRGIPEALDITRVSLADGATILLRRYGRPDGPRLVLSHGSGFAVDAYFPFWSLFLERFDVVVYDLRNHGHNPLGDLAAHHLPMMIWDMRRVVREIDRQFGAKPKIGVFHSFSAALGVFQVVEEGGFDALVLFDPPVCPPGLPEARRETIRKLGSAMAERTRKRQSQFDRWEDLAESYRRAGAFERIAPDNIDLLAKSTLRPREASQGYELCCPPEYEATLFEQLYKWAVAIDLDAAKIPLKVIGGDPLAPFSFLPTVDPEMVLRVDYDFVPESTHLLQLEEPETCAAMTIEYLEGAGAI